MITRYTVKLIAWIVVFGLIVGVVLGNILHYQFPNYYPRWFDGIWVYFIIVEALIIAFIEITSRKSDQKQLVNWYMLTKVVKIFGAIIYNGIYFLTIKSGQKYFLLSFVIFYILYLIFESILFLQIEKQLNKK